MFDLIERFERLLNSFRQTGKKRSSKSKAEFYGNLGNLLNSSIDVLTAIELLSHETKAPDQKSAFRNIEVHLKNGDSLLLSLKKEFSVSDYEASVIAAGESTGMPGKILIELSEHYRKRSEARKQIFAILSYPLLVLLSSMGVLFFMLHYMVPMFSESFRSMNKELPAITRLVITLSELTSYSLPYIGSLIVLFFALLLYIINDATLKKKASDLLFTIPFLKHFLIETELNRFFVLMKTMAGAKVQLTEAISHASEAALTPTFSHFLKRSEMAVISGDPFHKALDKDAMIPLRVIAVIRLAEETNSLEQCYLDLLESYKARSLLRQQLLKSIAEPVLILLIGTITGIIVIGMYLPILQMSIVE